VTLKRLFDFTMAAMGLMVLSPLFALLAVGVTLDSGGPVFYRGERVGKDGRIFHMVKFRSMRSGTARTGSVITAKGDRRVTRVGRFLRRSKLDELPQLLNVLRGEMSLVGPRPEDPRYVALYTEEQRRVLRVRPGITSPASIAYRDEEEMLSTDGWESEYVKTVMPSKLQMDLGYIDSMSFSQDIKVIAATFRSLWSHADRDGRGPAATARASRR
jgi:lipopolysaccharide/colanic/teichoic acid biosynthesis glycosyltransferase